MRTAISRVLALAALLAGGGCAVHNRPVPGYGLTVMTYNIQYGGGGRNLQAVASVIRSANADVVALQEVDVAWSERSDFADQAAQLATTLGMAVRFAPIYDVTDTTAPPRQRRFGVALLSRHPIARFVNRPLTRQSTLAPAAPPAPQPGLLDATITVNGTPVRVLNTHFDYRPDPAVREQQVDEILDLVGTTPGPIIVLGDFNAPPDAIELAPLLARFRDAWSAGTGPGYTFSSTAPAKRIDYVLVSDDIRVIEATVPAATASDHLPVVVKLVVPMAKR